METITLPKTIEKELRDASHDFGISRKDFLTNAVVYYLKTLRNQIDLKKELEMWDKISEQDYLKFEKRV